MCFKIDVRVIEGASRMMNFYRSNFSVYDMFTYQDGTGEGTKVYEHCGMRLVEAPRRKQYLVAKGKTLATGTRSEVLGLAYATRYGPDRILGTKLGEVFHSNGLRMSNKEIFIEKLGWHIEEVPGDKVYSWWNSDYSFYVYKITATDSEKYYIGVRALKKASATEQDCLNDSYMGSGGPKFQNWFARHSALAKKEILGVYSTREKGFAAEAKFIGTLYKTDNHCLNDQPGGIISGGSWGSLQNSLKECTAHGVTTHKKDKCLRCLFEDSIILKTCTVHGEVKHQGSTCLKCKAAKSLVEKKCPKHGTVPFKGNKCLSCKSEESYREGTCSKHGVGTFRGSSCMACLSREPLGEKDCALHGLTIHRGDSCLKCSRVKALSKKECPQHGLVMFEGLTCMTCKSEKLFTRKMCDKHGETSHRGDECMKCFAGGHWTVKFCAVHGDSKFFGESCWACKNGAQIGEGFCEAHGVGKFIGSKCYKCTNRKTVTLQSCAVHGESKHQGGKCCKCSQAKRISLKECPVHGITKHNGKSCFTCVNSR